MIPDLQTPSRHGWRRLCVDLDRLDDVEFAARLPELAAALEHWPGQLRIAPGRWLARLLAGRRVPGLVLARRVSLTLFGETSHADRLAWTDAPELRALEQLDVYDDQLDNHAISRMTESDEYGELRALHLRSGARLEHGGDAVGVDDFGVERLLAWAKIATITTLDLSRNRIGARGLEAIVAAPQLTRIRRLHLGRNALDAQSLVGLVGASSLRPAILDLDHNRLDGLALTRLARAPVLEGVRELVLSGNPIGREGCEALAASPYLRRIERLFLHACDLDDSDVEPLLRSPGLAGIDNLALSGNRLTTRSLDMLARCDAIAGISELDICHNHFTAARAQARLASAPALAGLRRLCV